MELKVSNAVPYIIATISGGPAEKAGIRAGDKIIKIEKEYVARKGLRETEILAKLRGTKGSKVK